MKKWHILTKEVTKETTLDIARKMKLNGIDINLIATITGLSTGEIKNL